MDVEPVVDLGVDSSVGVVTLEPIVVRNLKHTVLVKVGKTDVVVGSSFVSGYGDIVRLCRSVFPYEIVVSVESSDTNFQV